MTADKIFKFLHEIETQEHTVYRSFRARLRQIVIWTLQTTSLLRAVISHFDWQRSVTCPVVLKLFSIVHSSHWPKGSSCFWAPSRTLLCVRPPFSTGMNGSCYCLAYRIIIITIIIITTTIGLSPGGSSPTLVQTKIKIHKTTTKYTKQLTH